MDSFVMLAKDKVFVKVEVLPGQNDLNKCVHRQVYE